MFYNIFLLQIPGTISNFATFLKQMRPIKDWSLGSTFYHKCRHTAQ